MSASEIDLVRRRLRGRIESLLTPDELATYDGYDGRIRAALGQGGAAPIETSAQERAVLDKIAADTQAAGLDRQLLALLRVVRLPQ